MQLPAAWRVLLTLSYLHNGPELFEQVVFRLA